MFSRLCITLLLCMGLSACQKQVLYSDLSEHEANEIVALLYQSELPAKKIAEKSGKFRVDTKQSSFSRAVSLLQSHGLPRERFASLGDVFEKDGFVSSPLEERARLNYALSQEISRTISNIDGVIVARVHLAVPKKEHLADTVEPSSASVFVKHRADVDLGESIGKIKSIVVTGFENMPYENVTVGLFAAAPASAPPGTERLVVKKASVFSDNTSASLNLVVVGIGMLLLFVLLLLGNQLASRGWLRGAGAAFPQRVRR